MKIAEMIREALEKRGLRNLKASSKAIGISPELLRVIINKGHIPKDKTLATIADRLGLDRSALILAAHHQGVPAEMKAFFLAPAQTKYGNGKRKYPLSAEQCNYLENIMNAEEIQLLRKFRQVTGDARTQIQGYVDYVYATRGKR